MATEGTERKRNKGIEKGIPAGRDGVLSWIPGQARNDPIRNCGKPISYGASNRDCRGLIPSPEFRLSWLVKAKTAGKTGV
jgi:hypothetical protein